MSILSSEMNASAAIYGHWNSEADKECSDEDLNWGLNTGGDISTFIYSLGLCEARDSQSPLSQREVLWWSSG